MPQKPIAESPETWMTGFSDLSRRADYATGSVLRTETRSGACWYHIGERVGNKLWESDKWPDHRLGSTCVAVPDTRSCSGGWLEQLRRSDENAGQLICLHQSLPIDISGPPSYRT